MIISVHSLYRRSTIGAFQSHDCNVTIIRNCDPLILLFGIPIVASASALLSVLNSNRNPNCNPTPIVAKEWYSCRFWNNPNPIPIPYTNTSTNPDRNACRIVFTKPRNSYSRFVIKNVTIKEGLGSEFGFGVGLGWRFGLEFVTQQLYRVTIQIYKSRAVLRISRLF